MSATHQAPRMGPSRIGTLCTNSGAHVVGCYEKHLHTQVLCQQPVCTGLAKLLKQPALEGRPQWLLANPLGQAWLRVIDVENARAPKPFAHTGWMALEILVQDVDELALSLSQSPFTLLRPPADLALSPNIRACQVQGPAGEVLYLTQIKAAVPPFELPFARTTVDHLFIPVLCTRDRARALADYETLAGRKGLCFNTKITAINQTYSYPLDREHPVATLQLAGNTLIEIDQHGAATQPSDQTLAAGIAQISFEIDELPTELESIQLERAPYLGRAATSLIGSSGELIELVQRTARLKP